MSILIHSLKSTRKRTGALIKDKVSNSLSSLASTNWSIVVRTTTIQLICRLNVRGLSTLMLWPGQAMSLADLSSQQPIMSSEISRVEMQESIEACKATTKTLLGMATGPPLELILPGSNNQLVWESLSLTILAWTRLPPSCPWLPSQKQGTLKRRRLAWW